MNVLQKLYHIGCSIVCYLRTESQSEMDFFQPFQDVLDSEMNDYNMEQ